MDGPALLVIILVVIVVGFVITRNTDSLVQLEGIEGQHRGRKIPLSPASVRKKPFSIGRGGQNQLTIQNDLVSREHAQIMLYGPDQWMLYDRGSANGTWVNNERIAQHPLRPGDQIMIGSSIFVFRHKHCEA